MVAVKLLTANTYRGSLIVISSRPVVVVVVVVVVVHSIDMNRGTTNKRIYEVERRRKPKPRHSSVNLIQALFRAAGLCSFLNTSS